MIEKMKKYRNHRIVNPPAFYPCGDNKRMVVTEHKIAVPLDHPDLAAIGLNQRIVTVDDVTSEFNNDAALEKPTIDVYFSITELVSNSNDEAFFQSLAVGDMTSQQRADKYLQRSKIDVSRMILYLQGGPGFGCASPVSGLSLASSKSSWAAEALLGGMTNLDGKSFERVILMDQRGTGRSTPINKQSLEMLFPDMFLLDVSSEGNATSAVMQLIYAKTSKAISDSANYLTKFRADSIVRDAEWIREALVNPSPTVDDNAQVERKVPQPWGATLGQSFGGFCIMTYLSSISHPPTMCLFTGGIAPMDTPVNEVYDRLWLRVRERNWRYYEQYPGDVPLVKRIVRCLLANEVTLPSGGILTARRFLQLGLALGGTPGSSFANMHSVINSAFVDDDSVELSRAFLKRMDYEQSFGDAPLYFLLHESIYADGASAGGTEWAAHTSYEKLAHSNPEFDYTQTAISDESPILFFGEMVFPWMAHGDFAEVSGNGMQKLSESLAEKNDWLPLFDALNMRTALVGNGKIPAKTKSAAAVYYEDMYVDFDCCMKLVQRGMPLEGVKVWVTNEYQHSGLRDDGANIYHKLVSMVKGSIHVPS